MIFTKYSLFMESVSTKNMWDIIPESVKELHRLFKFNGKKLYLVGGSVRDFLTGDKPKDFDLSTDALPDEVLSILGKDYRTNLQGKAFGVVVVFTEDQPKGMEIATFREDISKGRNPEVKLGVTIEDDVKRRDLTYNALFYDLDKKSIVDLVGGQSDLANGITKMVGNAFERFEEDSLRILRAFRFASRYLHPLDKDTEEAILKRNKLENIDPDTGKMKRISQERIWEEIVKAWGQAKDFSYYLSFFTKFNMWDEVFPNFSDYTPNDMPINTDFAKSKNFVVVLANLFVKVGRDANRFQNVLIQKYKVPDVAPVPIARQIVFLINFLRLTPENAFDLYKSKERCLIDNKTILEWIRINALDSRIFYGRYMAFLKYEPSVSAEDLKAKGFKEAALGNEIKRIETENFKLLLNDK